jgi:hypothetical protein
VVFPVAAGKLDPLYKLRRGLLSRGQKRHVTNISAQFVTDSVWELLDMVTYISCSLKINYWFLKLHSCFFYLTTVGK